MSAPSCCVPLVLILLIEEAMQQVTALTQENYTHGHASQTWQASSTCIE